MREIRSKGDTGGSDKGEKRIKARNFLKENHKKKDTTPVTSEQAGESIARGFENASNSGTTYNDVNKHIKVALEWVNQEHSALRAGLNTKQYRALVDKWQKYTDAKVLLYEDKTRTYSAGGGSSQEELKGYKTASRELLIEIQKAAKIIDPLRKRQNERIPKACVKRRRFCLTVLTLYKHETVKWI